MSPAIAAAMSPLASPRAGLLAALAAALPPLVATGDLEGAQIAHEAIGRLLRTSVARVEVIDPALRPRLAR